MLSGSKIGPGDIRRRLACPAARRVEAAERRLAFCNADEVGLAQQRQLRQRLRARSTLRRIDAREMLGPARRRQRAGDDIRQRVDQGASSRACAHRGFRDRRSDVRPSCRQT